MNLLANARKWSRRTLLYNLWQSYGDWRFRTACLPKMCFAEVDGVKLNLGNLPIPMRERIVRGRYEAAELQMCRQILMKDDRVVEIGSGIGLLGIFATKRLGIENYFCVEANEETVAMLVANHELNSVKPRVLVGALSQCDTPVELQVTEEFWTNSLLPDPQQPVTKTVTVQGYRLPTLLLKIDFHPTGLIIDVEGAENCLLSETIPDSVRKMIIELHPKLTGVMTSFAVLNHLMNQGFNVLATRDDSYALARTEEWPEMKEEVERLSYVR